MWWPGCLISYTWTFYRIRKTSLLWQVVIHLHFKTGKTAPISWFSACRSASHEPGCSAHLLEAGQVGAGKRASATHTRAVHPGVPALGPRTSVLSSLTPAARKRSLEQPVAALAGNSPVCSCITFWRLFNGSFQTLFLVAVTKLSLTKVAQGWQRQGDEEDCSFLSGYAQTLPSP